jgi:hypothetical protein
MVLAVDDGDIDVQLTEVLRSGDACEPGADDHHSGPDSFHVHFSHSVSPLMSDAPCRR